MSGIRDHMSTLILLLIVITGVVSVGAIKFYSQKDSETKTKVDEGPG